MECSLCLQRLYDKGLAACVLGSDDLASHQVYGANQRHLIEPVFPFCKMGIQWHLPYKTAVRLHEIVCGESVAQSLAHRKHPVSLSRPGGT